MFLFLIVLVFLEYCECIEVVFFLLLLRCILVYVFDMIFVVNLIGIG